MRLKAEINSLLVATGALLALVSLLLPLSAAAVDACIVHPLRSTPCPHLIYKLLKLKADQPAKITCICVTDFKKFLTTPKDESKRMMQKMDLKSLAADLQLTEEQVASLAKR
jgi:hypothetical protein